MDHDCLRSLCLARGELEGGERERAEAHLAACPACRDMLQGLERLEAEARALGELPSDPEHPLYRLGAEEARAETESLEALRGRLEREIGLGGKR